MSRIPINLKEGKIEEQTSDVIVGIDLGTTNSLVAYVPDGTPKIIKSADGERSLMPSIIHFESDGNISVGHSAKSKLVQAAERTIYSVKRLLGKSYKDIANKGTELAYRIIDQDEDALVKIAIDNNYYTPIELSSLILKGLKDRAENEIGKSISKAVITVPAYFNDSQRQATRDAGKLAGLDVLRIVNEPTAASLAYGFKQLDKEQIIAVYDLGGGTFDVSILELSDGIFDVLSTNGDSYLGGDDFDKAIVEHWISNNEDLQSFVQSSNSNYQKVRLLAEEAKIALSHNDRFKTTLNEFDLELDLDSFETLSASLINKTLESCKSALKDAELSVEDIDQVVMVGGSTRMKPVKNAVKSFFNKELNDSVHPDEVVALGAAIQADILAGNRKDLLLLDITPLSLGIETVGGLMDVIIPRNSKVPTKVGRQYTTSVDGQKNLKISVYQGERDLVSDNRKLGEFILQDIPPMPAGLAKIEIHFILDADGILKVKAKELRSAVSQSITIKSQYGISEEDMAKMLLSSIQNAESDMKIKALLETRNEANSVLLAAEKFLNQNKSWLNKVEIETTQGLIEKLRSSTQKENKDDINLALENLNSYTTPLAHKALDINIQEALKGKKI